MASMFFTFDTRKAAKKTGTVSIEVVGLVKRPTLHRKKAWRLSAHHLNAHILCSVFGERKEILG